MTITALMFKNLRQNDSSVKYTTRDAWSISGSSIPSGSGVFDVTSPVSSDEDVVDDADDVT